MTRIRILCLVMFPSVEALNQFYCVCAVTAIVVRGLLCYSQILTSNCRLMVVYNCIDWGILPVIVSAFVLQLDIHHLLC